MPAAPSSTIPSVKGYLYDQLLARTDLAADLAAGTLLVSYDDPDEFQPDDIIALADVDREVRIAAMVGSGGAGWLAESYVQTVIVSVFRGGNDARATFERACALADVVIDVVRQDPSLGNRVIQANPEECQYQSEWATAPLDDDGGEVLYTGRLTTVIVPIRVSAHI